jgi:hypothetical protein
MANSDDTGRFAMAKMLAVLLPVIVGSLLGLAASLSTQYFIFQNQRDEAMRREREAQYERAMLLASKYTNDVGKALSVGIMTRGDVGPQDMQVLAAPTDTLRELNVVVMLHFRKLKGEIDRLFASHHAMMMRYDEIIDARDRHRGEDAAAFNQRIQKEGAPTMNLARQLMSQLSERAARERR